MAGKKTYHSDETESDIYQVKKRKKELTPESSKVQMSVAQFVNMNSVTETATSATVDSGLELIVDTAVEVYKYCHTKKCGTRNTLFVMSDKHQDLRALKKSCKRIRINSSGQKVPSRRIQY